MSFMFSQSCVLCASKSNSLLCSRCTIKLPSNSNCCEICAKPLSFTATSMLCGRCLQKKPLINKIHAPFLYQQPITYFIAQLKFNKRLVYAKLLSSLIEEYLISHKLFDTGIIIPVPLHKKRLRERGFNQAIELIKPLAKKHNQPIESSQYIRTKKTCPQSNLRADQRANNVKNAFSSRKSKACKDVLIVDDVITTGNTINEFSTVLKRNGAKTINVICIAHSVPKN